MKLHWSKQMNENALTRPTCCCCTWGTCPPAGRELTLASTSSCRPSNSSSLRLTSRTLSWIPIWPSKIWRNSRWLSDSYCKYTHTWTWTHSRTSDATLSGSLTPTASTRTHMSMQANMYMHTPSQRHIVRYYRIWLYSFQIASDAVTHTKSVLLSQVVTSDAILAGSLDFYCK